MTSQRRQRKQDTHNNTLEMDGVRQIIALHRHCGERSRGLRKLAPLQQQHDPHAHDDEIYESVTTLTCADGGGRTGRPCFRAT